MAKRKWFTKQDYLDGKCTKEGFPLEDKPATKPVVQPEAPVKEEEPEVAPEAPVKEEAAKKVEKKSKGDK